MKKIIAFHGMGLNGNIMKDTLRELHTDLSEFIEVIYLNGFREQNPEELMPPTIAVTLCRQIEHPEIGGLDEIACRDMFQKVESDMESLLKMAEEFSNYLRQRQAQIEQKKGKHNFLTKQPSLLRGGTLKNYQMKGLN